MLIAVEHLDFSVELCQVTHASATNFVCAADAKRVALGSIGRGEFRGFFAGCEPDGQLVCADANRAYIITPAEWDALLYLNAQLAAETMQAVEVAEAIAILQQAKDAAESQRDENGELPSAVKTETGSVFKPHLYTKAEYMGICECLRQLED